MERAGTATGLGVTPGFLQTLLAERGGEAARAGPRVQEQDLRQWGLTGQWLRANFRLAGQLAGTRLPGPGSRPTDGAGRCEWSVLRAVFLRTTGPPLPAPAVGLGGEESRCRACAARGSGGRSQSAIPGPGFGPGEGELGEALS